MNIVQKISLSFSTIRNWPLFIMDFCKLLKTDVLYTTNQDLQFIARGGTTDVSEIIVVVSGTNYPLHNLVLDKHPVIIDLGGYIGDFCIYAYNYFRKLAPKIYVFEPSLENYNYLQKNLNINSMSSKIASYNQGIATVYGKAYLQTQNKKHDEYSVRLTSTDKASTCNVTTLQKFLKSQKITGIDVLKIDIEGGEYDLLTDPATLKIINTRVKYLFIELHEHRKYTVDWVKGKLKGLEQIYFEDHILFMENESNRNEK